MAVEKGKVEMDNHYAALVEAEQAVQYVSLDHWKLWVTSQAFDETEGFDQGRVMKRWAPSLVLKVAAAILASHHEVPPYWGTLPEEDLRGGQASTAG